VLSTRKAVGWRCSGVEEKNSDHMSGWNTSAKKQKLTDKKQKTNKIGYALHYLRNLDELMNTYTIK